MIALNTTNYLHSHNSYRLSNFKYILNKTDFWSNLNNSANAKINSSRAALNLSIPLLNNIS